MCKAFSCIVTRQGKVYWEVGVDSHDDLIHKYKIRDDTVDMEEISHAKIEIVPANKHKYPYLYPKGKWKLQIDERVTPSWLLKTHKDKAWEAWREWKEIVYNFNYQEARNPINPLKGKPKKPTKTDIKNLKAWASVRTSVRDLVWAYISSLFPNIKFKHDYKPCIDLWERGFVPSFDGETWRLHSGKDAKIVYELEV